MKGTEVLEKVLKGSLEYAAEHLKVPLLLVPGQERCGAVKTALEGMGSAAKGVPGELIREIEPAVRPVLEQDEEAEDAPHGTVCANFRRTMSGIPRHSLAIAMAL